jgi:hypothetical protein
MKQRDVNAVVITSDEECERYSSALLALLRRIDILGSDATLNEELKAVYELLKILEGGANANKKDR